MSKPTVAKNAAAIKELREQISELKTNFEKSLEILENKLNDLTKPDIPVPPVCYVAPKSEHDVLIIGDSIVSSVDTEMIDPEADITIDFVRGGRPIDISNRFEELTKEKSFKRVIVHVGTNLIPRFSPSYVADQVLICLERIKQLSPSSKVTFSSILPKYDSSLLHGINIINNQVMHSGKSGPIRQQFSFLSHRQNFANRFGFVNSSLFNADKLHLSLDGKLAFNLGLNFFIGNN